MLEVLIELLGELLLQVIGEALFEMGLHVVSEPFRKQPNPWLAGVGYAIFGALLGALTLWLVPTLMVRQPVLRWLNLLITPVVAGACMSWLGAWRERRGQQRLRLDRFLWGYVFALALAVVRFTWAQ
jgi:hypothetical protein